MCAIIKQLPPPPPTEVFRNDSYGSNSVLFVLSYLLAQRDPAQVTLASLDPACAVLSHGEDLNWAWEVNRGSKLGDKSASSRCLGDM